jgi:methylenetetrahydrofolate dehydrogenase (NADP+) / methenyltetrahydrofolate cyclohydrolase
MTAKLMLGKELALNITNTAKEQISKLPRPPKIAIIRVGNDPASEVYIKHKIRTFNKTGIDYAISAHPEDVAEETLIAAIQAYNQNGGIDAIIMQLPVSAHIDSTKIINYILPDKDVDGLTVTSLGSLVAGTPVIVPATPKAIIELLKHYKVSLQGKHVAIVGRSNLVGKPLAHLLLQENCTVTISHSKTADLGSVTRAADIVIAAVGKAGIITADMVASNSVLVDVGITRVDKKLFGDFAPDVLDKAAFVSPVPGGVGPVTVACLVENIVQCAQRVQR